MDQLLMRAEEVARALGLGRSKVYEMMQSGELPVVRIGRSVRVSRVGLEEWLRQRTSPIPGHDDEERTGS